MNFFHIFLKLTASAFLVHTDVSLDYYEAVEFCKSTGARLALFDNAAEFQCVCRSEFQLRIRFYFQFSAEFGNVYSWVGGNDFETEGVFLSEDGLNNYFHWSRNEPNDHGGNEDCVTVWGKVMNDYPCTYKGAVTCKTSHDASAIIDVNNIPGQDTGVSSWEVHL